MSFAVKIISKLINKISNSISNRIYGSSSSPILKYIFGVVILYTILYINIYVHQAHHLNKSSILATLSDFFPNHLTIILTIQQSIPQLLNFGGLAEILCRFQVMVKMKMKKTIRHLYSKSVGCLDNDRTIDVRQFPNTLSDEWCHNGCHPRNS